MIQVKHLRRNIGRVFELIFKEYVLIPVYSANMSPTFCRVFLHGSSKLFTHKTGSALAKISVGLIPCSFSSFPIAKMFLCDIRLYKITAISMLMNPKKALVALYKKILIFLSGIKAYVSL
mmetsp:Transcript_39546/g.39117  ORF Transcript_39546/g.39117 Transcript_39546/m.39117 type:complete len:120 (+) Transcript_39546:87-446(+)